MPTNLSRPIVIAGAVAVLALGAGVTTLMLRPPGALEVCRELTDAGVARACESKLEPIFASEKMRFELTGSGSHGIVETYASEANYRRDIASAAEVDVLLAEHGMAPHRFQNDRARVRVMLVRGADERAQKTVQRIVEGL